jgi:NAD(P)-dependent dehydrogenase (short-subunit alcohol dehydrogenase family)
MTQLPPEATGSRPGSGRLLDRRVLVVGAGTITGPDPDSPIGNGRAICVLSAREGASVACLDVEQASARVTADLVEAEGAHAVVLVGDASDPSVIARLVEEARSSLGTIDGLVLNVGIGRGGGLSGTSAEDWDATFAANVRFH